MIFDFENNILLIEYFIKFQILSTALSYSYFVNQILQEKNPTFNIYQIEKDEVQSVCWQKIFKVENTFIIESKN